MSSEALGLPTVSNFSQVAAHVRRQEREDRKRRRDAIKAKIADQHRRKETVDCKDFAEATGRVELPVTALGKHSRTMHETRVTFSASAAKVEQVIRSLAGWMQIPIYRTYVYEQPHRIAARELRMDESTYRDRWRAAVKEVARQLAFRESGAVHSPRPPVRVESA
jgi:hypothetical protein